MNNNIKTIKTINKFEQTERIENGNIFFTIKKNKQTKQTKL